jgi:hypothetical protein
MSSLEPYSDATDESNASRIRLEDDLNLHVTVFHIRFCILVGELVRHNT